MQMKELVERLSQLRALKLEVNRLSQRIAELELEAKGGSRRWSGLPRIRTPEDRAAKLMTQIVTLQDKLEARRYDCMEELGRLYDFIDEAPTSQLRLILAARYIDGLSWQQVAFAIKETDEQVPRRMHNRYLTQIAEKTIDTNRPEATGHP